MQIARIFKNGRSQAVRLPKEYRLEGDRVSITRVGEAIVLQPIHSSWVELHRLISPIPDFMENRCDLPPQERESF